MALSIAPLSSTNTLVTQYYTLPIILSDKNVLNNITKNTLLTTSSTFNGLGNNRSTTNTSQNLPVYETHHYLMNKLPYQASSIFDIATLKSADIINSNLNHNHQYSSNLTNNLQNTLDSSLSSAFSTDFTSPTNSSVSFDEVSYNNFSNHNINNSSTYISNNLYQSGFSIYGFPHNKQRKRTHYTQEQLNCLEDLFQKNHYPNSEEKKKLSYKIDIEEAKIHVWFQNRRSRENKSKKFGNKKMKITATNSFEDSESNLSQDIMDMNNESYQNDQCEQNITTHFKSNNFLDSSYKSSNIGYTFNNINNQYIEIANNNCNNIKVPETSDNMYFLSKYIYDKKTNQIIEQKFDYNNVKNLLIHNQSHMNEVLSTPLLSNFLNKSTGSNTMQNGTLNHNSHAKSGMLNVQWNNNVMFKSINDSNNLNGNVANTTYNLNDYININKNLMVASKAMILTNSSNGCAYIPKNIVSDQNCAMVKGNDNILNLNRSSSILDLVNGQNSTVPTSATTLDNLVYSVLNKCKPSIYLEHNYKTTSIENGTSTAMTGDSNNKIYNNFNINVDKEPENLNNAINCYNKCDVNTPSYGGQIGIDPKQKSTTMDEMISKPIQPISDYVCSGEAYENFGCQQYPAVSDNAHCSNNSSWSFFLDDTVDNGMDLCNEEFASHNSISTPNYYENKTPSPLFDFPTDIFQSSPLPLSVTTGKNNFTHATHNYFPNESINDDLYTDSCPQIDDNYELKNFLVPSPKYEIPGLKSLNEQTSFFETLSKVEFEESFKQPTNQLPPLSYYFKHSNNQSFKDNADTTSKETFDFFHDETPINMAETLPSNLSYNINNSNLNGLYDGFEMADIFPNYENM